MFAFWPIFPNQTTLLLSHVPARGHDFVRLIACYNFWNVWFHRGWPDPPLPWRFSSWPNWLTTYRLVRLPLHMRWMYWFGFNCIRQVIGCLHIHMLLVCRTDSSSHLVFLGWYERSPSKMVFWRNIFTRVRAQTNRSRRGGGKLVSRAQSCAPRASVARSFSVIMIFSVCIHDVEYASAKYLNCHALATAC